jgi:ferredoxin-NADP reductase
MIPPLLRSYSLSGPPGDATYRTSVKGEPHGTGSRYLHTAVRAGDIMDVAEPRGTFTLNAGSGPGSAARSRAAPSSSTCDRAAAGGSAR